MPIQGYSSPCLPTAVWDEITMDFIEGLPKSHDKEVIMVVIDRLSKYAHFCALSHPFNPLKVESGPVFPRQHL